MWGRVWSIGRMSWYATDTSYISKRKAITTNWKMIRKSRYFALIGETRWWDNRPLCRVCYLIILLYLHVAHSVIAELPQRKQGGGGGNHARVAVMMCFVCLSVLISQAHNMLVKKTTEVEEGGKRIMRFSIRSRTQRTWRHLCVFVLHSMRRRALCKKFIK